MIRLKIPRAEPSAAWSYLAPVLAVALTVLAGFLLFALMGYDPFSTLYHFFISPISTRYGIAELIVKATPLVLIGVGLSIGFRANVWNIGAEGQLTLGAIAGGGVALWFHESERAAAPALDALAWALSAACVLGAIPAFLKTRFNVNEILTSLMLTYVATLLLSMPWSTVPGRIPTATTSPNPACSPMPALHADPPRRHEVAPRGRTRSVRRGRRGLVHEPHRCSASRSKSWEQAPRAARLCRLQQQTHGLVLPADSAAGWPALPDLFEVAGPIGQLVPQPIARLRFHRDHRRFSRPPASARRAASRAC